MDEEPSIILAALLCGKWTDAEGDKDVLEYLSGKKYEECMAVLRKYESGENPFIISISMQDTTYQIASIEEAWVLLRKKIDKSQLEKFIERAIEVLLAPDPKIDFRTQFEAQRNGNKLYKWSPSLKKGMIRSFILWTCINGEDGDQIVIDQVIGKILNSIDTIDKWTYISEYIVDLCEAAPEPVLSRLEKELKASTGMQELFSSNTGYTSILWAIEQLIQQKPYIVRAIKWLWEMDSKNYKYHISNSPRSVLEVAFCAWFNVTPLSKDDKIREAGKALHHYQNAWDIISDRLPKINDTVCATLSKPNYKDLETSENENEVSIGVTRSDIREIYEAYLNTGLENQGLYEKALVNSIGECK